MALRPGHADRLLIFPGWIMVNAYHYISSNEYINSLVFNHVEMYSFQRGAEFEKNLKLTRAEYNKLQIKKVHGDGLTFDEEKKLLELNGLLGTQYLLDANGQFHPSAKKTNTFLYNDPVVLRLTEILNTQIREVPHWMCAPVYRDALVFYDQQHNILSALNICLSCQYMETKMFNHLNADYKTYKLLKQFFIDIGHEVENT